MKTDSWFQSCKALKMNSFAKNHENNDGHGSLLVLTLRWYCSLQIEKMTKMVIGGSQLITGWYSEVTMLPLEGAALAYINTFLPWTDWFTITLVLLLTVFRILFHPYAIVIFHALLRLLVNVFADLIIYNAESTQLVYNSGQKLPVCSDWYWV